MNDLIELVSALRTVIENHEKNTTHLRERLSPDMTIEALTKVTDRITLANKQASDDALTVVRSYLDQHGYVMSTRTTTCVTRHSNP